MKPSMIKAAPRIVLPLISYSSPIIVKAGKKTRREYLQYLRDLVGSLTII